MQLKSLASKLTRLGLTEKQAKVYVASMFLGPAPAQKIAEQAGINRPTTYDILEELAKLGLISQSKEKNKTTFISSGTEGLQSLLDKGVSEAKQRAKELETLLPELQNAQRTPTDFAPSVRFVHGKAGVDSIWAYVMRKAKAGDTILSLTNFDEVLKVYPDQLKTNPPFRVSKRLHSRQFYYCSDEPVPSDPTLLRTTKRLLFPPAADVTLYEDMAVLLCYGTGNSDWTGIIIEDKDIVTVLRQLFNIAWEKRDSIPQKSVDSS